MLIRQVALVSETASLTLPEVTKVSAALQKQATRDFGPIWDVQVTVDAFDSLDDVPIGYWPVIVRDDIQASGAAGFHEDKDGQPFALVEMSEEWALTASHETLEMLADPFGNRVVAGPSPKPGQRRVEFLVEVCDPSEGREFGYTVNGILLSDFYTPKYFDPAPAAGVRYSFTGAIQKPRQVRKGGYLSWHDPITDHWFQETFFSGAKATFRDLGKMTAANGNYRSQIDRMTNQKSRPALAKKAKVSKGKGGKPPSLIAAAKEAAVAHAPYAETTASKANKLRAQIDAIIKGAKANSG